MRKMLKMDFLYKQSTKYFFINCNIGNICNYKCSYCEENLHNSTIQWLEYDKLINFIQSITANLNKKNKIPVFEFTGGEVTCNKDLPDILKNVKALGAKNNIITNGSRSLDYYENIIKYLDCLVFSYHAESANTEEFIRLVKILSKSVFVHANIMMHPKLFDLCLNTGNIIEKETDASISYSLLVNNFSKPDLREYDEYQLDKIKKIEQRLLTDLINKIDKSIDDDSLSVVYNKKRIMKNFYDDGSTDIKLLDSYVSEKINNWFGWHCECGSDRIVLNNNGDVFNSWCLPNKYGNIYHNEINLLEPAPIICHRNICFCEHDMANKRTILKQN